MFSYYIALSFYFSAKVRNTRSSASGSLYLRRTAAIVCNDVHHADGIGDGHLAIAIHIGSVDIEDDSAGDEDVLVIDRTESELNLNQFVYDYICLGLPLVKVHPEGKCNPEMLRYLTESEGTETGEEGEMSRPFEGLKDLLESKNN